MQTHFEEEILLLNNQLKDIKNKSFWLSWVRAICFIATAITIVFYFNSSNKSLLIIAIILGVLFYISVIKHRIVEKKKNLTQTLIDLNTEEIERINLQLHDFHGGVEFKNNDHPYQDDLDIFGKHSIFQLVNRCEIFDSKKRLAQWLSTPTKRKEIIERQDASRELKADSSWLMEFRAFARISIKEKKKQDIIHDANDILKWASQKSNFSNTKWLIIIAVILSLSSVFIGFLILLKDFPYQLVYPSLLINGVFLLWGTRHLSKHTLGIDKANYIISAYANALEQIEKRNFNSIKLQRLQKSLTDRNQFASKSILSLSKIVHRIAGRANMLYVILDILFLLDIHLLVAIIKWKRNHQPEIEVWLEVVHEIECLMSIASFSNINPNFAWPQISNDKFIFETQKMGHPLIPSKEKTTNDYLLSGSGSLDIITGSNMSGKSTFQRTVGVNMVLAQAGCPVNAESLTMSTTQVFTSMRTKDNLEEHTSSFYAELKRIVQLLAAVDKNESTFFILDEILKGTNSEDRHLGSIALAEKLANKKAFGLISTHDLGLGSLADKHKSIRNYSFNSTLKDHKIIFDYTLTEGICKSFNASQLMKNMGILE